MIQLDYSIVTGTSVQGLMRLANLAENGEGPDEIGDEAGETFLHLLGLCLEIGEPRSLGQLIARIGRMDPLEFRLTLLGLTAWSWRSIVGEETIQAAASGDAEAQERLLADDRYYGQHAAESLGKVMPLGPVETKTVFIEALETLLADGDLGATREELKGAANRARALAEREGWIVAIEKLTGYRYLPEPEARSVAIMPHLAGESLSLVQHHETRLIVYGERRPTDSPTLLAETGKALADPNRIKLLAALSDAPHPLGDLDDLTWLTRSTVHHHLRVLRQTGLVSVRGNAHNYEYAIDETGRDEVMEALAGLFQIDHEKGDQ